MMLNPNAETVLGKPIAPNRNVFGWLFQFDADNPGNVFETIAKLRQKDRVQSKEYDRFFREAR